MAPERGDQARWQQTLDRVSKSVVVIRMDRPRGYEGVGRGNSQATGFVIDAELGLVLTNRHVVTGAPVQAEAVFLDNEVLDLVPVYRDPVHDFGIFRYDPSELRHLEPEALPLHPELARVGEAIRVVGNDSGEKLSILDGTLSRLDRPAPVYGGGYSDFDTFYIQAASATSGGSSGSPVVDIDGNVVAMNAGGKTTAATAFYLPLDRVVRAVGLVRKGQAVPRGTWLTRAEYTPWDELGKLGLAPATEAAARAARPAGTGLLVVREVLPEGPASGRLEIGDVLVSVGGVEFPDFVAFEEVLDGHVGAEVAVVVERAGERRDLAVPVSDLHAEVAGAFLEVGGAVVHDLSIHQARGAQIAARGVVLAETSRMWSEGGVSEGAVLQVVDGHEIADLADFERVVSALPDDRPVVVRWFPAARPSQQVESAVRMDRKWSAMRRCTRPAVVDPSRAGEAPPMGFSCEELPPAPAETEAARPVVVAPFPVEEKLGRLLQPALVGIRAEVPVALGGGNATYAGGGLVVDAARGWVLVDRDTVPHALCEVRVLLGGALEVPAQVVLLHEAHNLAIIEFDPALASGWPLAEPAWAERPLAEGEDATFVGLERDGRIAVDEVTVDEIEPFVLRADGPPRFRETNLDVVRLAETSTAANGVIVDKKGRVSGFQASFSYNDGREPRAVWGVVPTSLVSEVVALARGRSDARMLGWELSLVDFPTALERGLPPAELEAQLAHDPARRAVLQVLRTEAGDPVADALRPGDLVLKVGAARVATMSDVEAALRGADATTVTFVRDGQVAQVDVAPRPVGTTDVTRVVSWAGLRAVTPDRSGWLLGVPRDRPYVSYLESGSPAGRGGLYPGNSVVAINDTPIPDLDTFARVVAALPAGEAARVALVNRDGRKTLVTVEPDPTFFPAEELVLGPTGWERRRL